MAYSHDSPPQYVTHKIAETKNVLQEILRKEGCYVYYCGPNPGISTRVRKELEMVLGIEGKNIISRIEVQNRWRFEPY